MSLKAATLYSAGVHPSGLPDGGTIINILCEAESDVFALAREATAAEYGGEPEAYEVSSVEKRGRVYGWGS